MKYPTVHPRALTVPLYTKSPEQLRISEPCRIVVGERGPYLEFNHLPTEQITVPNNQVWRHEPKWKDKVYYFEYRTTDGIMVYFQRKTVKYADYKVGCFYISPWDVIDLNGKPIIDGPKPEHHL